MRFYLATFLVLMTGLLNAQSDTLIGNNPNAGNFRTLVVKIHHGRHYYTGSGLKQKLVHGYGAIELRTAWQTKGKHAWEKQLNYPAYGIGWYSGYVGDYEIFGNPNALFGFITIPVKRWNRISVHTEQSLGLTYNLKPYNPDNNQINDAIGAKLAVYFSLHAGMRYKVTRELDMLFGWDLTHFSNGRSFTPNFGLNMGGFSFGIAYHYNATQQKIDNSLHPKTVLEARPTLPKHGSKPARIVEDNISIYQAIGTVQNPLDAGTHKRYITSSTVLEYQHKFNTMHGVTVGFDAFMDPGARDTAQYPLNKEKRQSFFPGVHVGQDFMFWKLTVKMQAGVYLSSLGRELKKTVYLRPAIRYEANKKLFAQVGLKTFHGAAADWIEFGLGYKVYRSQYHKK